MMGNESVNNVLRNLMMAQRAAHVHHWQVKSLSVHLALGELYDGLTTMMDTIAETYMGISSQTVSPSQSDPNHFSEQDPLEFVRQLSSVFTDLRASIPQDPALLNVYDDLLSMIAKIKYKLENLH